MTTGNNSKDTVYVDVDDEITTVIDKVRSSAARVVALVLPKRATVFQSVVNMKLLKRSADAAKKHVVLVTTEAGLLPLAGAVGLHVAATPQSRPEIPMANASAPTDTVPADVEDADEGADKAYTVANAGHRPIGELAGADAPVETLRLPDDTDQMDDGMQPIRRAKNKRLQVPNFNKFRVRLFLGVVALVLIIFGLYVCLGVLPKAAIAITTETSDMNVSLTATLDDSAHTLDTTKGIVPAKVEQQQKTASQQVSTTGEQNNGERASGTVQLSAQKCAPDVGQPDPVPAGAGISTSGLTFITQEAASFAFDSADGSCVTYSASAVPITSQNAGSKYNVDNATFSVAGRSDVGGTGSASGGTDQITHIVAQADIDNAKQKLTVHDTTSIKSDLEQALRQDGMYPLPATFKSGKPTVTASSKVGDTADTVTVTQAVTYTMYGASKTDLQTLIAAQLTGQIDPHTQSVVNDGLDAATVSVVDGGKEQIAIQTKATIGPTIDPNAIKRQAAGKKAGDVKKLVGDIPGVTSVDVRLSPFWVSTVPGKAGKVTVTISGAKRG